MLHVSCPLKQRSYPEWAACRRPNPLLARIWRRSASPCLGMTARVDQPALCPPAMPLSRLWTQSPSADTMQRCPKPSLGPPPAMPLSRLWKQSPSADTMQRCPKPSLGPFGLHATGWAAFPFRRAWARRLTPHSRERPVQTQRAPERAKSATALAERGEQSQKAKTASALQFGSARAQHPPRGPRELCALQFGSAQAQHPPRGPRESCALPFGSAQAQHPPRGPRELYAFALEGSAQPANAQSRAMA